MNVLLIWRPGQAPSLNLCTIQLNHLSTTLEKVSNYFSQPEYNLCSKYFRRYDQVTEPWSRVKMQRFNAILALGFF